MIMLNFNKDEFLQSDLGIDVIDTINSIKKFINDKNVTKGSENKAVFEVAYLVYEEKLKTHILWLKGIYGVEYSFFYEGNLIGLISKDRTNWLVKEFLY